jgi:hypothetical protein
MQLGSVTRIRQHARTGTKAYMSWIDTGEVDAIWAPQVHLQKGQILAVTGFHGHGAHHEEPVFYIKAIGYAVARRLYRGWMRHERRRARSELSSPKVANANDDPSH